MAWELFFNSDGYACDFVDIETGETIESYGTKDGFMEQNRDAWNFSLNLPARDEIMDLNTKWLQYLGQKLSGDRYVYDAKTQKIYELPHGMEVDSNWEITHIMRLFTCPTCGAPGYSKYSDAYKDECECTKCATHFINMREEVFPPEC